MEKVATATGILKSNLVGLSVGRLALASQIDSVPLPGSSANAELKCMSVGREGEAAPAGARGPLFEADQYGFLQHSLHVDSASRAGFCVLLHLHVTCALHPCLTAPPSVSWSVLCPLQKQVRALGTDASPAKTRLRQQQLLTGRNRGLRVGIEAHTGHLEGIRPFGFLGDCLSSQGLLFQHLVL